MAISIDASGVAIPAAYSAASSTTVTVSTTTANDLIVVIASYNSSSGTHNISSVTSSHLTFTKYTQSKHGNLDLTCEVWTAPASGTITSEVITVNFDVSVSHGFLIGFGVVGLNNADYADNNGGGLPTHQENITTSGPVAVTYSTTKTNDIIFGVNVATLNASSPGTTPTGWSGLAARAVAGSSSLVADYKVVSSPQTSQSYQRAGSIIVGGAGSWSTVVFAFSADATNITASGALATVTMTGPAATPIVIGPGSVGTISMSAPTGATSLVIGGTLPTISMTAPLAKGILTAVGALSTVTVSLVDLDRSVFFSEFTGDDFLDWGVQSFVSFFDTCQSLDDPSLKTQTPWIYTFTKVGDNVGAFMTVKWDWRDGLVTDDRYFGPIQIYKQPGDNYRLSVAKTKVRGKGRQVHMRVTSDAEKDFDVLGWVVFYDMQAQQ